MDHLNLPAFKVGYKVGYACSAEENTPAALTDANARAAKPREKTYKLYDDGLFLLVTPSGGRLWRFRYKVAGKEKVMALGKYPREQAHRREVRTIDPETETEDGRSFPTNPTRWSFRHEAREGRVIAWPSQLQHPMFERFEGHADCKIDYSGAFRFNCRSGWR